MLEKNGIPFLDGMLVATGECPRYEGVFLGPSWCFCGTYTYFRLIDCVYMHSNGNVLDQLTVKPPLPQTLP